MPHQQIKAEGEKRQNQRLGQQRGGMAGQYKAQSPRQGDGQQHQPRISRLHSGRPNSPPGRSTSTVIISA